MIRQSYSNPLRAQNLNIQDYVVYISRVSSTLFFKVCFICFTENSYFIFSTISN